MRERRRNPRRVVTDAQGAKLAHDFPASFACYAAKATGAIDLARLISEAVEQAEKGGRDA